MAKLAVVLLAPTLLLASCRTTSHSSLDAADKAEGKVANVLKVFPGLKNAGDKVQQFAALLEQPGGGAMAPADYLAEAQKESAEFKIYVAFMFLSRTNYLSSCVRYTSLPMFWDCSGLRVMSPNEI